MTLEDGDAVAAACTVQEAEVIADDGENGDEIQGDLPLN